MLKDNESNEGREWQCLTQNNLDFSKIDFENSYVDISVVNGGLSERSTL